VLDRRENKRIDELDIVKALAIILMVAGHSDAPFTSFIYLFHMAVFFIASGYFYKDESSDSIKSVICFVKRKMKKLWFPYFGWNAVFILANNLFIKMNIYTDNPDVFDYVKGQFVVTHDYLSVHEMIKEIVKSALFAGGTELGGAFWFLKILFGVSVCYCITDFIAKKVFKKSFFVQFIISLVLLCIGFYCSEKNISVHGLELIASCYGLYFMGYLLMICKDRYVNWNITHFLPIFMGSFLILLVLDNIGEVSLGSNSYENPIYLIVTSFLGWCF
jgi:fucose 4-O-acetylase-like acetyltransferase